MIAKTSSRVRRTRAKKAELHEQKDTLMVVHGEVEIQDLNQKKEMAEKSMPSLVNQQNIDNTEVLEKLTRCFQQQEDLSNSINQILNLGYKMDTRSELELIEEQISQLTANIEKINDSILKSQDDHFRKITLLIQNFKDDLIKFSSNIEDVREFFNKAIYNFAQKIDVLVSCVQDVKTERTISYQLGKILIDSKSSVENLISIPNKLRLLRKENLDRKSKKIEILVKPTDSKVVNKSSIEFAETKKELKSTIIAVPKQSTELLNKKFIKALTLLDPISELCWQDGFPGFAISRKKFEEQIASTTSDFAFFESAWKANKSQWLYAFNSPNLQHKNAQDLLKVIGLLRAKKLPVVFWNKEDPMHYEMFMPIAKEADYVFTTDSLKVEQYKKDLGHSNVWSLPFAAPIKITNPINRFKLDTETVCFAGTYYAKNHPDRKTQMDMLLPTLLKFNGAIYDRASNTTSENYQYPQVYHKVIREGVEFDEMTQLYKKFKVFLNVNTITQSPTMMSRRVYELLASGTPVVSTPSKAITEQFPGIVLTVRNEEEAKIAVEKLLTDSFFWNKQSVLGIREVMSNHTYEDRWLDIKAKMQGENRIDSNKISLRIVAIYHGYQDINFFIKNLLAQSQEAKEIVILKSSKLNVSIDVELLNRKEIILKNTSEFNVNSYVKSDLDGYTFFTTDSVVNFKNCIKDMLLSFKYHTGYAATRKIIYDMNTILKTKDLSLPNSDWFSYINSTNLDCLLIKNKAKDKVVIDLNIHKAKALNSEDKIYLLDPFNIATIEKRSVSNPTIKKHEKFKYVFEPSLGI